MSLSPVHPRIAGLLVARVFTSVLTFMNRGGSEASLMHLDVEFSVSYLIILDCLKREEHDEYQFKF